MPEKPLSGRYEDFPYPHRDPEEEKSRLLIGSPSDLREIDHYIYAGERDWSLPFRVLVVGGGTGDGLIMLAQQLEDSNVPHEIVYVDSSQASGEIACARAKIRGITSIEFIIDDFLEIDDVGEFDYVDCCGVLHHLPDPQVGFDKISSTLNRGGGMGGMVYAPLGRTGVYPLQSAFSTLLGSFPNERQVADAKSILTQLPKTNWIWRNPFLNDHKSGDAEFFDLLLHVQDRPFWSNELYEALQASGMELASFIEPISYDSTQYLPADFHDLVAPLSEVKKARLAEELCGSMRTHVFYAIKQPVKRKSGSIELNLSLIPQPMGDDFGAIFTPGSDPKNIKLSNNGNDFHRRIKNTSLKYLSQIDGIKTLGGIADEVGEDWTEGALADLKFLISCNRVLMSSLKFE